jgi:hypothetical protein
MDLIGKALTTCQVDMSGEFFRLNLQLEDGRPCSVTLPIDCVRSLLMTLPGMIERALKARYGEGSFKLVYRAGGWALHQATDSNQMILTLQTEDGFKVAFALSPKDAADLASSLAETEGAVDDRSIAVN